jgi:hypothetical protein
MENNTLISKCYLNDFEKGTTISPKGIKKAINEIIEAARKKACARDG